MTTVELSLKEGGWAELTVHISFHKKCIFTSTLPLSHILGEGCHLQMVTG